MKQVKGIMKRMFSVLLIAAMAVTYAPVIESGGEAYADIPAAIVQLEAGYNTSAALLEDGALWVWGCNEHGEVDPSDAGTDIPVPQHVMDNVKDVELGDTYSRALTNDGILWEWGRSSASEPRKVAEDVFMFSGDLVLLNSGTLGTVEVSKSGSGYTYALTNKFIKLDTKELMDTYYLTDHAVSDNMGELHTWGTHRRGQLGLKPSFTWEDYAACEQSGSFDFDITVDEHTKVKYYVAQTDNEGDTPVFTKAIIGKTHSAYLTDKGELYYSGVIWNSTGQWYEHVYSTPNYAASDMKDLYLGCDRLLVKNSDDNIICYGGFDLNKDGSEADIFLTQARVTDQVDTIFKNCDLFAISDSVPGHMLATDKNGKLWVRGANDHGQLGLGNTTKQDSWVSGDAVLETIYGEGTDPGDDPGDTPIPEEDDDIIPGTIEESNKDNPGQTWGLKIDWGEETFSFTNNRRQFGQENEDAPHLFSNPSQIFKTTDYNCKLFYNFMVGEDKLAEIKNGYFEGTYPHLDLYGCIVNKWGQQLNEVDRRTARHYIETKPWGGSCFGMSTMVIMNYRGFLSKEFYNKKWEYSESLYNLEDPYDLEVADTPQNLPLKDALGFYQSLAGGSTYATKYYQFAKGSIHDHLHALIYELKNNVKKDNTPILLSFTLVKDDSYLKNDDPADDAKGLFTHAVVAYALETGGGPYIHDGTSYKYRIRVIDPNFLYKAKADISKANQYCIYVTADEKQCYLPQYNATSTVEELKNTGDFKIDYYSAYGVPLTKSLPEEDLLYQFIDIVDFGSTTGKVNNTLVSAGKKLMEGVQNVVCIPANGNPAVRYTLNKDSYPDVEITQDNDCVGYQNRDSVVYVSADKGSTMQFEYQGVKLHNAGGEYSIDVTVNNGISDLADACNVVVSGEGEKDIEVQAGDQALVIDGEDLDGVQVQVGDKKITLTDPEDPEQTAIELYLWDDEFVTSEHYYDLRTVEGRYSELVYTGKVRHPKLTVIAYGEAVMQEGVDYELTWPKESTKIGNHYAKIHFIGKYANLPDEKVLYKIIPGRAKIRKVTSKNKAVTVRYYKVKGAGGYRIAIRRKGTTKWKYYKVTGNAKLTKTIKKLRKGKTYQVKVRAFKTVKYKNAKGKTISTTFNGKWSAIKKIKVK